MLEIEQRVRNLEGVLNLVLTHLGINATCSQTGEVFHVRFERLTKENRPGYVDQRPWWRRAVRRLLLYLLWAL